MPGLTGIYKIQSIVKPNRCYVGSAVNILIRWSGHLLSLRKNIHANPKLQAHFNKYGKNDLIFSILLCCDKGDLIAAEQFFIDSLKPWFNISQKAGTTLGNKWSEKAKAKLRVIRKLKPHPMLGKHHTEESRQKNRDAHKYIQKGKDHPNYGRSPSVETREKLRVANLDKHPSEETKQKMRETMIRLGKKPPLGIGRVPWNKGLKNPEGIEGKISKLKIA